MPQLVPGMNKTGSPSSPISMSEQFTSIQITAAEEQEKDIGKSYYPYIMSG